MTQDFAGNARFEVVRTLGAGGMGVVYEVKDREQGDRRVALKTLKGVSAEGLMRMKREFRALADVVHPNLVTLHELFADAEQCFFTMELLDGVDFLRWVRPGGVARDLPTAELAQTVRTPAGQSGHLEYDKLEAAFRQLVLGVRALHANGRLHRDLKPSNVLVTPAGRVVILDFGLVANVDGEGSISEQAGHAIVGTAAYMAPEQAGSGPVTPAADWYSVGSMLFQALTGRLPFEGPPMAALVEKQRKPAPSPLELDSSIDPSLAALATALLRTDPAQRPTGEQVMAQLGVSTETRAPSAPPSLVGREAELELLQRALAATREGSPRVVRVIGQSGIGKTSLVRHFLELAEQTGAVVLAGRCYEREAVPFKALDAAGDALARYLASLPHEKADALLPRDASALARMFPVLKRVALFARAPVRDIREPAELRRRAAAALRELLGRLADRVPVVIFLDDLQWGDADSAGLLEELCRGTDAPSILWVLASRPDVELPLEGQTLQLQPLDAAQSRALAVRMLPSHVQDRAEQICAEAEGNPFLLQQLAAATNATTSPRLEKVIDAQLAELPEHARKLLELVSVAGHPLEPAVAFLAAGAGPVDAALLQRLKSENLLKAADERLEPWHDRIREAISERVAPDRSRDLHRAIADAIEAQHGSNDAVAQHLLLAGEKARAAEATLRAADAAAEAVAFDRAAMLLGRALELLPFDDSRRRERIAQRAQHLADAGFGALAASAFQQALTEPGPAPLTAIEALGYRRRAAEQLLHSGHVDEGLLAIRKVVADAGMTLALAPWRAFVALAFRRAHLYLRGLDFTERPEAEVNPELLARIDVCWSVSVGLAMIDTIRGASFQTRQLLLALDAGEPTRIARALAAEAAFLATQGTKAEPRVNALLQKARQLATRIDDARVLGLITLCEGLSRFLFGAWKEAHTRVLDAERLFADAGAVVTWEAASARLFSIWSLFYLGELPELGRRLPSLLAEARARGDRYTVASLQSGLATIDLLARDEPAKARSGVRDVLSQWTSKAFHFQHYWGLLSEGMTDLYEGSPEDCWQRLEASWPQLRKALLLQIQNIRVEARSLRARSAVATGRFVEALADAERLEAEDVAWGNAHAMLIRAAVAQGQGDLGAAKLQFGRAIDALQTGQMHLFSAAARWHLGGLEGGELGAAHRKAAEAWLHARGVRAVEPMVRTLVPTPPPPRALPG